MTDIHKLIAAISPDVYCDPMVRKEVKRIVKNEGYLKAAEKAKPIKLEVMYHVDQATKDALRNWGLTAPSEEHSIIYDSATDGLEKTYFWILDFLNDLFGNVDKIIDNFVSSPGSSHFSELQGKASQMQQEAGRVLSGIHIVIKTIMGMIYDLKEFKLKIDPYNKYHSKDPNIRGEGLLSLKSVWMDNIDVKRGQGSINAMTAGALDFVTLRDAFFSANSTSSVDKIDLNDRVKRILRQRLSEFFTWIKESELSLKQRFEIEKNYLKTQVNTLKLYSRWVKPYMKAAAKLEQNATSMSSALVNVFNTIILELSLMGKNEYKPLEDDALPEFVKKSKSRKYYSIVFVDFHFRGIPQKVGQRGEWGFGGRTEVLIKSYALNEHELKVLKEQLSKDDMGEVIKLIDDATTGSLDAMQKDIEEFTRDGKMPKEKESQSPSDVNPFTSLFAFLRPRKKKDKEVDLTRGIKPDNAYEKTIRSQAILEARKVSFKIFDIYKRDHYMVAHESPYA